WGQPRIAPRGTLPLSRPSGCDEAISLCRGKFRVLDRLFWRGPCRCTGTGHGRPASPRRSSRCIFVGRAAPPSVDRPPCRRAASHLALGRAHLSTRYHVTKNTFRTHEQSSL